MRSSHLSIVLTILVVGYVGILGSSSARTANFSPRVESPEKVNERLDAHESRLKLLEEKLNRATLDAEYTQRVQKQYETYYEKAFNTQVWTLGLTGLILSAVFGLAARFGLGVLDTRVEYALKSAASDLKLEYERRLLKELTDLRDNNFKQITSLESELKERIVLLEEDLKIRSDFQFYWSQGISSGLVNELGPARSRFREAVGHYKRGKQRQVVAREMGVKCIKDIFTSYRLEDAKKFAEQEKIEQANKLYEGLEEEMSEVATQFAELNINPK